MALVKTCPTCESANAPTSPFCTGCGVSLVSVAPTGPAQTAPPPSATGGEAAANTGCPECGAKNVGEGDRCVYCDYALTTPRAETCCVNVELTWPWGKQVLTGPMRIGRDPPADESLIKSITDLGYNNISRSHADMVPDAATGGVSVVDLGSSNGTFVDGVRIPANKSVSLKSGAVVRFAANLSVTIAVRTEPCE